MLIARSLKGVQQKSIGADKYYDTSDFMADQRIRGITPHLAQNIQAGRCTAIDGRTVLHQD